MPELSPMRLIVLRGAYLVIAVGLLLFIWPAIVGHDLATPHMNGVVSSMLGGVSLLALLGLRNPAAMIPVLLFELVWKALWLVAYAAPLWAAGGLDAAHRQSVWECLFGVVFAAAVIPWPFVYRRYVTLRDAPAPAEAAR